MMIVKTVLACSFSSIIHDIRIIQGSYLFLLNDTFKLNDTIDGWNDSFFRPSDPFGLSVTPTKRKSVGEKLQWMMMIG